LSIQQKYIYILTEENLKSV